MEKKNCSSPWNFRLTTSNYWKWDYYLFFKKKDYRNTLRETYTVQLHFQLENCLFFLFSQTVGDRFPREVCEIRKTNNLFAHGSSTVVLKYNIENSFSPFEQSNWISNEINRYYAAVRLYPHGIWDRIYYYITYNRLFFFCSLWKPYVLEIKDHLQISLTPK